MSSLRGRQVKLERAKRLCLHQLVCLVWNPWALGPIRDSPEALISGQFRGHWSTERWAHRAKLQAPYGRPRSLPPYVFYQYPVAPASGFRNTASAGDRQK